MKALPNTTCQICARPIHAKRGTIAHHGYTRPHHRSGWQTASCPGTHHKPYEVSCDALPPAIASLEAHIARAQARRDQMMTAPDETLTYYGRGSGGRPDPDKKVVVPRPEGFDPLSKMRTYRIGHYDTLFHSLVYELEKDVEASQHTLNDLRERLASWKPVAIDPSPLITEGD